MLSGVYYNGACAQSLDGKPEDAKATLQKAIELGFSDLDTLRNDADLAAVRALPGFDQQLAEWEKLIAEKLAKEAEEVLATGETFPFDFALTDLSGQNIESGRLPGQSIDRRHLGNLVQALQNGDPLLRQVAERVRSSGTPDRRAQL